MEDNFVYSLVADSGIHVTSFPMELSFETKGEEKDELLFEESITQTEIKLDLLKELYFEEEGESRRYLWAPLEAGGFLSPDWECNMDELADAYIEPLPDKSDDDTGYDPIFKADSKSLSKFIERYENKWLPIPYYHKLGDYGYDNGPYNWARMKLVPRISENVDVRSYNVILAFDSRIHDANDKKLQGPSFPDNTSKPIRFGMCDRKLMLMDFCAYGHHPNSYIYDYLLDIAYPNCHDIQTIKDKCKNKLSFLANYIFLMDCIAKKKLFPDVVIYRDGGISNLDLVVDIGNSRTMAVFVEDGCFEDSDKVELLDFTKMQFENAEVFHHKDSIDMHVAFHKVDFGTPIQGSSQFVYPSLVRLGNEANYLMFHSKLSSKENECQSSNSSPKRYLWDFRPSIHPWKNLVLEGEKGDGTISLLGITDQLMDDGRVVKPSCIGGVQKLYSRRSLMTFAFLEILAQTRMQTNSHDYRMKKANKTSKRVISRLLVTCPTAWSKTEREALIQCAKDAAELLKRFYGEGKAAEVIPQMPSRNDSEPYWYYDEATCSQMVYMFGEIYKYKGNLDVLFNLFGKKGSNGKQTITIGSLDIGAGTSDLMIGEYSYNNQEGMDVVTPDPRYYDSFYYAGDDMLQSLIQNVLYLDENSALRKVMALPDGDYRQLLSNVFDANYRGQVDDDREFRRAFNLQYAVPLMSYFLRLNEQHSERCEVTFEDVFEELAPNDWVCDYFEKKFQRDGEGVDLKSLVWTYDPELMDRHIFCEFEPLLKMVATIMHNSNPPCDIVLISGRPASLPSIRNVLLKYYPTSPDRIILVNNHFVDKWYPFTHNTGYVDDPKTIVAVGALLGLYGSKLNNLGSVKFDLSKLNENLKSTVNYVLNPHEKQKYVLSTEPEALESGSFNVPNLPVALEVRQLDVENYQSRPLYVIDYNKFKMAEKVSNDAFKNGKDLLPKEILNGVREKIDTLRLDAPFTITLARDKDDKEQINIVSIVNSKGEDQIQNFVEIHTQSMGINEQYWLDTGAFKF